MLVFNQKFVSGSRKIKSTIEGLAFDRPSWAIMPDLLRTLIYLDLFGPLFVLHEFSLINLSADFALNCEFSLITVDSLP